MHYMEAVRFQMEGWVFELAMVICYSLVNGVGHTYWKSLKHFVWVQMDDEDKYLAKMEAGLYTLQVSPLFDQFAGFS